MTAHYSSIHGQVAKAPEELYMAFCDLNNFSRLMPEQYKDQVEIVSDYDNLSISFRGFKIEVRVEERRPYSLLRLCSVESPVEFVAALHFEPSVMAGRTDFCIVLDANLNFMMKTMLGNKVQEVLDKLVNGMVDVSEGNMPKMPDDLR